LFSDQERPVCRKFTVSLVKDPDSGWFAARCVELPEAISQGHTEAEALKNIREAVEFVLDEHRQTVTKEFRCTQKSIGPPSWT